MNKIITKITFLSVLNGVYLIPITFEVGTKINFYNNRKEFNESICANIKIIGDECIIKFFGNSLISINLTQCMSTTTLLENGQELIEYYHLPVNFSGYIKTE